MPSVWIRTRPTADGGRRFRVEYQPGGREAKVRYGGSFKTRRCDAFNAKRNGLYYTPVEPEEQKRLRLDYEAGKERFIKGGKPIS
jgi:hypothetical protein